MTPAPHSADLCDLPIGARTETLTTSVTRLFTGFLMMGLLSLCLNTLQAQDNSTRKSSPSQRAVGQGAATQETAQESSAITRQAAQQSAATAAQQNATIPEFLRNPAYRSSRNYEKSGTTDGNRVWITFFNTGLLGGVGEIRGMWPRGSGVNYIGDVSPVVSLEVPIDLDNDGVADTLVQHGLTNRGPRAGQGPRPGQTVFWGFEPMGGFAAGGDNDRPAISIDETTWPTRWPDQPDWVGTDGQADWNGFFGRGIQNADFETYFWADDHNDELLYNRYGFLPDSTDPSRKGQGLALSVRGLQWSQFLAQDAVFFIYELTNTSTTTYPRVSVGLVVGTAAGESANSGSGDTQDDLAFFDQANQIVYSWDNDGTNNDGSEVGYVGYAFMESPGEPIDGIDNDGDGDPQKLNIDGLPYVPPSLAGTDNTFSSSDFEPRVLAVGDPLILIDEATAERTIAYVQNAPTTVVSQGRTYTVSPGDVLEEDQKTVQGQIDRIVVTDKNLIDEDLDGLVDEDVRLHFIRRQQNIQGDIVTLPALRFKNYVGFADAIAGRAATREDSVTYGLLNSMIDESPSDGIDNDGDWNPLTDDVGIDGVGGTGDEGEGDGKPSLGEPNFDRLDVDETDQIGLSSFYYFTPPGAVRFNNDEQVWNAMSPGFFTTNEELAAQQNQGGIDGDFIFSSGYKSMKPGETLRFSMALVFGEDLENITNNVTTIQEIYNRNYNFARPPDKPTLKAAPGNGRVTLYWDSEAELSVDPILGQDFEGYKLYKSTEPNFLDPKRITDAFGNPALLDPIAQFDLKNGIKGVWQATEERTVDGETIYVYNPTLADRVRGVPFVLGDDTGLEHSYVDSSVDNGQTYYYALTAYDRGSIDFYPAENNFSVSIRDDGTVITDKNVVQAKPLTPVLGYEAGSIVDEIQHTSGFATGDLYIDILDPFLLENGATYSIDFKGDAKGSEVFDVYRGETLIRGDIDLDFSEAAIFDGMRVVLQNDPNRINQDLSGWKDGDTLKVQLRFREGVLSNSPFWQFRATSLPYDYEIQFSDQIIATTLDTTNGTGFRAPKTPSKEVKFKVVNVTKGVDVPFAFDEGGGTADGEWGRGEFVYIYDEYNGQTVPVMEASLVFTLLPTGSYEPSGTLPENGDIFSVKTLKAFSDVDRFSFTTKSSRIDEDAAKAQLDRITVVPNPYIGAASWEGKLPPTITSGRGERKIQFQNIPEGSTIRIFTSRGELVRVLEHQGTLLEGVVDWDLRSRENLDIAYGIYFYHVEAPGIGVKTGKLAIIK